MKMQIVRRVEGLFALADLLEARLADACFAISQSELSAA